MKAITMIEEELGYKLGPFKEDRKVRKGTLVYQILVLLEQQGTATRAQINSEILGLSVSGIQKDSTTLWCMLGLREMGPYYNQPLIWRRKRGLYELTSYGYLVLSNSRYDKREV